MKNKKLLIVLLFILTIIFILNLNKDNVKSAITSSSNKNLMIIADTTEEKLYLIDTNKNIILKKYPIASGKKQTPTPIGNWRVVKKSQVSGIFGTRWIKLNVPYGNYGIHGTNTPKLIGTPVSHGCIRMFNKDVNELYRYVYIGMKVNIYAGPKMPLKKGYILLKPGDKGSSVLEVQKNMKDKGYYKGILDGIYGNVLKKSVINFRKENNLPEIDTIDNAFYQKLIRTPNETATLTL